MKRIAVLIALFLWIFMPVEAFAKEKGRGVGRGMERGYSGATGVERSGERVGEEVIEAVADELAGAPGPSSAGLPPGLAKKGSLPPGLEKQGKIPPGWEKGKKEGWDKSATTQESGLRRLIRRAFRGAKDSPPEK